MDTIETQFINNNHSVFKIGIDKTILILCEVALVAQQRKIIKKQSKVPICQNLAQKARNAKISNDFQTSRLSSSLTFKEYIERVYSTQIFTAEMIFCAGLIFKKILESEKLEIDFNAATVIKCFSACLHLIHKYTSDLQYSIDCYCNIFGFKAEKLRLMETYLFVDILNFNLSISPRKISKFLVWIFKLTK